MFDKSQPEGQPNASGQPEGQPEHTPEEEVRFHKAAIDFCDGIIPLIYKLHEGTDGNVGLVLYGLIESGLQYISKVSEDKILNELSYLKHYEERTGELICKRVEELISSRSMSGTELISLLETIASKN